jgi:hypothetical protein
MHLQVHYNLEAARDALSVTLNREVEPPVAPRRGVTPKRCG